MATALFDGVARMLNDTFGARVTIYPGGGGAVEITAVVRDRQVDVGGEDEEPVAAAMTIMRALKADVVDLVAGDRVEANGVTYEVEHRPPAESPADDRFETFVLDRV